MLKGQTALVTGASRGIGRACALALALAGADIAVIYAGRADAAADTVRECQALGVRARAWQCEVQDFKKAGETVSEAVTEFGNIGILVNNAGVTRDKLILRMGEEDYDAVMDINLKGAFNMTRHAAGYMVKKRFGRIINISSVSGLMGNAGQANYSAAKAGLIGLTKTVARELAPRSVTCNAVAPGFIETDMTKALGEDVRNAALEAVPLKRMGLPGDVAECVLFLARAPYITGEVIKVDGGLYI
ncbi:MAG: 3-oxoacyl-[acyl-carrier-protein] reductase [Oscillospiraceae bacterium]|jgi:3-oxoacyl-[acyl-carrier protein] reductase|nr:3-oxoacyl-[acyl-carrier-protein] reductase [Oscillospiraceae bacterium]